MWNSSEGDIVADEFLEVVYGPDSQSEGQDLEDQDLEDQDLEGSQDLEEQSDGNMSSDDDFDELPVTTTPQPGFSGERRLRSSSHATPHFSPLTSLTRHRDRSRSPLRPGHSESPLEMVEVLAIYDVEGRPIDFEEDRAVGAGGDDDVDDENGEFRTPDENDSLNVRGSGRRRARSVRGRGRGVRGRGRGRGSGSGRGQSRGRGGGRGRAHKGEPRRMVGQPLSEIWLTDDVIPLQFVSQMKDIMRMREERARDVTSGERNRRERYRAEREEESGSEEEDGFADASDGRDNLLEGQNLRFDWSSMESFQGKEEDFRQVRTGAVQSHSSAYDAFCSYWTEDILDLMVTETNRYAATIASVTFQSEWYPTNSHEILCLFAFWMMLGIIRMPTLHSCFSVNPLLKTEAFRRIFTRTRYEHLSRALHFVENPPSNQSNPSNTGAAVSSDRVHRLRPILNHLNLKFQENYILQQDICIDESLTPWQGKLDIRQYIRSKASKFGVKTFELCESATGYLWSFIVYTGTKESSDLVHDSTVLKSTAVVKQLMGPLLHKGHRLFMDNWYNSPHLARFLKLNGTDCVGTLRPSRTDVPAVINVAPLRRGELVARHSGDVCVLAWQDKTKVTMISTCHGSSAALPRVPSKTLPRPVPFKPQVVLDYTKFMGGVDLKDQMLEPYLLERKRGVKWYMKLFKRLLNVSILNSRILLQSSTQRHHDHLSFRLQLVDSILTQHLSRCPSKRNFHASTSRSSTLQTNRIADHPHWPVRLAQTDSVRIRTERKRCIVCVKAKRDRKTTFKCEACDVPLCVEYCFKTYHSSSYSVE